MIRAIILAALLIGGLTPSIAQDNNPFSGATSISVEMTRDKSHFSTSNDAAKRDKRRPFHLRCTLNGKPMADWRERAGVYRVTLDGETLTVPPDAAGPMMVLLWAGGARCSAH